MKLFELYKQWMETGTIGRPTFYHGGLCNSLPFEYRDDLELLKPQGSDFRLVNATTRSFWAYDGRSLDYRKYAYEFTPLRQNIVLFICAMNDEL